MEVRAPDSRGLLHRLTKVISEAGLDVMSALVSTMGHEVVDAFYVRGSTTSQPLGAVELPALAAQLAAAASRS